MNKTNFIMRNSYFRKLIFKEKRNGADIAKL